MKHLNFLSKSSSQSCGHSSVTLASNVGSQEEFYVSGGNSRGAFTPADVCQTSSVRLNRFTAQRRGTMLKHVAFLLLFLFAGFGQMWGADPVASATAANGKEYVIAYWNGSKYIALDPTKVSTTASTFAGTDVTVNASGKVTTANPPLWTLTVNPSNSNQFYISCEISSTTYYLYKNGTSNSSNYNIKRVASGQHYWTFSKSSNKYSIKSERGSAALYLNYYTNGSVWEVNGTSTANLILLEVAPSCTNSVTIAKGTESNATLSFSSESVATCSATASDRQVTVSVAPASCYAAPVAASVTTSGTTATPVSGPTWNNTTSKYDYVYQFAQNAKGTTTFNVSLSTKTTYTVNYNKGTYGTGDNSSDTKTCGESLTLPGVSFTRTGYTQAGWSTAQAGTSKAYDLSGSYTTNAATTLYPYWVANSYSVTWKVNNTIYSAGGSATVNHGSHISTLPTPPNPASYCGDKFVGWTTDEVYTHGTSPLYTTASGFPTASNAQTFYAVFADYDE